MIYSDSEFWLLDSGFQNFKYLGLRFPPGRFDVIAGLKFLRIEDDLFSPGLPLNKGHDVPAFQEVMGLFVKPGLRMEDTLEGDILQAGDDIVGLDRFFLFDHLGNHIDRVIGESAGINRIGPELFHVIVPERDGAVRQGGPGDHVIGRFIKTGAAGHFPELGIHAGYVGASHERRFVVLPGLDQGDAGRVADDLGNPLGSQAFDLGKDGGEVLELHIKPFEEDDLQTVLFQVFFQVLSVVLGPFGVFSQDGEFFATQFPIGKFLQKFVGQDLLPVRVDHVRKKYLILLVVFFYVVGQVR